MLLAQKEALDTLDDKLRDFANVPYCDEYTPDTTTAAAGATTAAAGAGGTTAAAAGATSTTTAAGATDASTTAAAGGATTTTTAAAAATTTAAGKKRRRRRNSGTTATTAAGATTAAAATTTTESWDWLLNIPNCIDRPTTTGTKYEIETDILTNGNSYTYIHEPMKLYLIIFKDLGKFEVEIENMEGIKNKKNRFCYKSVPLTKGK